MKDIIKKLKKLDTWKIQLTVAIKFISSKDNDKENVIQWKISKSDNTNITSHDKADEAIEEFLE